MKKNNVLKIFLAVLGICAAAAGVFMSFYFQNSSPIMLKRSADAQARVVAVMDAVCTGDYTEAGQLMYGTPNFGPERDAAEAVSALYWTAFSKSMSYELIGDSYADGVNIAQKVRITCLDFESVTEKLRSRFLALLEQRVKSAQNVTELYDEHNNYRKEMVMELLLQAAEECLREDACSVTVEVTVKLTYDQGQWWVIPEAELMRTITGGILK